MTRGDDLPRDGGQSSIEHRNVWAGTSDYPADTGVCAPTAGCHILLPLIDTLTWRCNRLRNLFFMLCDLRRLSHAANSSSSQRHYTSDTRTNLI